MPPARGAIEPRRSGGERAATSLAAAAAGKGGMAASHRHTDAYMADMYRALEDMGVDTADDAYKPSFAPACSTVGRAHGEPAAAHGSGALPAGLAYGRLASSRSILELPSAGWATGPVDPAGRVGHVSGRNLLCMSVLGDSAVVGSADHGLVEVELGGAVGSARRGAAGTALAASAGAPLRARRTLYTKQYGHSEWVTDVTHLPDGRILSSGMDSKLCLWNGSGAPRCADLLGHTGSVSKVLGSADGSLAISASYDKTLRVWSTGAASASRSSRAEPNASKEQLAVLRAHRAPVMHLAWVDGVLGSADRDGAVVAWDVSRGAPLSLGSHEGHATALAGVGVEATDGGGLISGGHDGMVRLWDLRAKRMACGTRVHEGAVNELIHHRLPSGEHIVLSAGADRRVLGLEPRMDLRAVFACDDQRDFIYSLTAIGGYAVSGGGDGSALVHELPTGRVLYSLPANTAAVRAMHADVARLVCAGDDGSIVCYDFGGGGGGEGGERVQPPPRRGTAEHAEAQAALASLKSKAGGRGAAGRGGGGRGVGGVVGSSAGGAAGAGGRGAGGKSEASAWAEKRQAQMQRAAAIKAQRAAEARERQGGAGGNASNTDWGNTEWGELGGPPAGGAGPMGGGAPGGGGGSGEMSELDQLHALGDKKFGRGGRR